MSRYTMPSLNPRKVISPPSLATAGRTRASINSLIAATVSESFASKNSSPSADAVASTPLTIGAPDMQCSIMAPRIAGLSCCHSPALFVTAMKSEPKNTPDTPVISNRRSARGDWAADCLSRMSSVPLVSTARPGRNLSVAGFGAWPLFAGCGGEYQDGDVFVVFDEIKHFLRFVAFPDHPLRHHAGDAGRARGVTVEHGIRLLVRLRTHDVSDAEPLLVMVAGLDHAQHEHGCADAQRTPAREIERPVAFWRIVDDDHELRRVTCLVPAALLAHCLPRPSSDVVL